MLSLQKQNFKTTLLKSGIGGIPSGNAISRPTENSALKEIIFCEDYQKKKAKLNKELESVRAEIKTIEDYVNAISDEILKEYFKCRFYNGESWIAIAQKFHYSPNSWMIIQKKVDEYINNHSIQ